MGAVAETLLWLLERPAQLRTQLEETDDSCSQTTPRVSLHRLQAAAIQQARPTLKGAR